MSQAGIIMGLIVMLDAHTDILTAFSVRDDFDGFTAIVTPPNDFPLIYQQGFGIKTGNFLIILIFLSATDLNCTQLKCTPIPIIHIIHDNPGR
jgi:hypothetical protein